MDMKLLATLNFAMILFIGIWFIVYSASIILVSLGKVDRIKQVDRALAKDYDSLYDKSDTLKNQLWPIVGARFMYYCLVYPFIMHRASKKSFALKGIIWFNCVGSWLLPITIVLSKTMLSIITKQ
ncbi:hypothetical protein N9R79_09085 [Vibrio sp.]|nr:hypothetical protein [Vibrio sp.]